MLSDKIKNKQTGFLFYGLTPPKKNTEMDAIQAIANKQIERLKGIDLDALVLYDIQDEAARNNAPRPFPFMQTLAPDDYSANYLKALKIPKIIYQSVGKYTPESFKNYLQTNPNNIEHTVFVGSPSKHQENTLSLQEAYQIKKEVNPNITLGGVTIPERHQVKEDEHLRVKSKIEDGCSYFISQCVYNIEASKNFISDYYMTTQLDKKELAPLIFTLTPCGSLKTLEFMNWLGIDIPKWLKNDLKNSEDILSKSVEICKNIAVELFSYCTEKKIPVGFNIESVSIRKQEIDASIELLKFVKDLLEKTQKTSIPSQEPSILT